MNFWEWISTMTVDEVADTVLEYLKVLVWPLFFLIVLRTFRVQLRGLLARLKSVAGGPVKASFHDIVNTAKDAADADADASRQQEEESGGKVQGADGQAVTESPGGLVTEGDSENHVSENAADHHKLNELLMDDSAEWQPLTWRSWQSSRHKVDRSWRDLERVTAKTVKSYGLSATDPHLEKHPEDPALFFRHMHLNYGGSRKAVEAAISARRLRKQISEGVVIDRDEAEALAGAIDDLRSSAQKYDTLLAGRRLAKHLLEKYGDERPPTMNS